MIRYDHLPSLLALLFSILKSSILLINHLNDHPFLQEDTLITSLQVTRIHHSLQDDILITRLPIITVFSHPETPQSLLLQAQHRLLHHHHHHRIHHSNTPRAISAKNVIIRAINSTADRHVEHVPAHSENKELT
jgi:hypothetical protein